MKQWFARSLLMAILLLLAGNVMAREVYPFDSAVQERRFYLLIAELRCMVCENQSLMDSEASLAVDLRQHVYELVQSGKKEQQIVDLLVDKYGQRIHYRPPFSMLWVMPVAVLLILLWLVFRPD